ncbi:MAG: MBL fold metallo-hydrolase [Chloroflexota bacterium]|nr:MBL fold metallo-hydrolase [Chloroflexota bacterium]
MKGGINLEITWYGQSCFRIVERGRVTVITDPFSSDIGLETPRLKGDIVTISHDTPGHNAVDVVKGTPRVLRGAGEYEISNVFITGIATPDMKTIPPRQNIAYRFDYDNLSVLHLGDLTHVPDQSFVQLLGEINVLMLPVGGGNGLRAPDAAEVVALLEPHFVIPMHYALPGLRLELDPVEKFLKAMGVSKALEAETLKVSSSELPEQTQVIVLSPSRVETGAATA